MRSWPLSGSFWPNNRKATRRLGRTVTSGPDPCSGEVQVLELERMPHEELVKLAETFAKNWLAHDGSWFLAAEEKLGMQAAIDLDRESWRRFSAAEARRIMEAFAIPAGGGLRALEKALTYRLYAKVNKQVATWTEDGTL